MKLPLSILREIEKILLRGNTAEIKKRKNDIILIENRKEIKISVSKNG